MSPATQCRCCFQRGGADPPLIDARCRRPPSRSHQDASYAVLATSASFVVYEAFRSGGCHMARRVHTGCNNCKRCTNSGSAEFGRRQGKLWANVATGGGVAAVQAFTPNCRACGHKMSLHDRGNAPQGNSYPVPVMVQVPAPPPVPPPPPPPSTVPAGWYRDPNGQPCSRWWDGYRWTDYTAPLA